MFSKQATFVTALLESALAVAIGMGILLVPMSILWLAENDASIDWMVAYRNAADFWLAAHGVHIFVPAGKIAGIATPDFMISLVPLGLSAIIAYVAYRLGKRIAATPVMWPGWVASIGAYFGFSLLITTSAHTEVAFPVEAQGVFQPALLFGLVLIASSLFAEPMDLGVANLPEAAERVQVRDWARRRAANLNWVVAAVWRPALIAGTAVTAGLLALSALSIGLLLAFNWIDVIRLYEGLQLTLLGGIMVTLGQIGLLPNLVVYGADWFTGAGFVLGHGSLVSPLGSQLGPLPSMPVLAALPPGQLTFGMVALVVPVVLAFVCTLGVRKYADLIRFEFASATSAAISLGLSIGVVAAIEMALLNLIASGGIGPGRFQDVGGNWWLVGGVVFVEVAVMATLAAFFSAKPEAPDQEIIQRARQPRTRLEPAQRASDHQGER